MPAVCAAVGCFNSSRRDIPFHVHAFPSDPRIAKLWVSAIQRDNFKPSKWSVLCSAHFTADAYEDKVWLMKNMGMDYKPRLKQDAVPTIFSHKRRQPQRTPGAFAKRRRMEIVSELLSSPAGPSTSCSVALQIPAEPLTEAIICTEPVPVGAAEGDCPDASAPLDFSVPCVNSDTSKPSKRDKSVQVLVRPGTKSAHTQARAPARSIGVQTFFPRTNAACQTSQWKPKEADPGESCDELGEPDREDPGVKDDKDYIPSEEYGESFAEPHTAPDNNRVFLVAEVQFRQLFKVCPKCYASCQVSIECEGTVVEVISKCPADHHSYWVNQDVVNQQPLLNLLLCAGILFAGCNPTASLRTLSSIGVQVVCEKTFFNLQRDHLQPAIDTVWSQEQAALLDQAKNRPLKLAGDGRADSPGFSAKYGTYSVLDLDTNKIVHFELVQSNEVGGSGRMELAGLKRSFSFLESQGLVVDLLVTDRHVQGKAFMKKEKPNVRHEFDVWHVAKGIKKQLHAAVKIPICAELALWSRPIQNHLYWVAASSEGSSDLIVPKWLSVLNHVRDVHSHRDPRFASCAHGELEPRDWLSDDSAAFEKLENIVTKKCLLADLPKLSTRFQTYTVEAFHSLIIHFCPKSCHYSYKGMKARTKLAILHYNENGNRPYAFTEEGEERFRVKYPKANGGEGVAVQERKEPTHDYVKRLLDVLREGAQRKTRGVSLITPSVVPPPLCSSAKKVSKAELIQRHKTRFNK
ncbi:uncharacterized protein LOC8030003 isoform X2 [Ixodes scapularis]|uniref:uncharacterized protein LOC8030003 isoform X2 n=1 Tax=Ixodes scapularis TaxID=6945 RepID=UPI001A9DDF3A|nr:uncharacterized protein LOC8030003 isoform X2 [Ixodes scapularis]